MGKKSILLIFMSLVYQNSFAEYLGVGGYVNTGFETMTCKKMIQFNLGSQLEITETLMSQRGELIKNCKPKNLASDFFKNITGEKKECLKKLNEIDNIVQTHTDFFMRAVSYRIQMYDIQNLPKSKFVSTCDLNSNNIKRSKDSDNDYDYLKSRVGNCVLLSYSEKELSEYYKNNNDFKDRQVCQKLIDDYDRSNGESFLKFTINNGGSEKPIIKQECISLNCEEVRKKRYNLASECYRDAFVTCMTTSAEYTSGKPTSAPISVGSGHR